MATVYLAHDVKHDRKVALKVLKPELAAVIGAERFLAEINDVSPDGTWFVFARRGGSDHIVLLHYVPDLARRIARTGTTP